MSESKYWQIITDLVSAGADERKPKHEVAEDIITQVHTAHAQGEPWATEVIARWDRDGASRDYTDVHKKLNSVTYITRDGRRKRKTASYSRTARSAESGEVIGQQLQVWWGMSRAALYELRTDMADQVDRLSLVVEAIDQLIEAMDRHPECETAREAWEADGRSIAEIDLSEAI